MKKPVKAKLNRKGILQLADDLVANQKHYDQHTFGEVTHCGTTMCLAGFCYRREVGPRRYNRLVKNDALNSTEVSSAANKQLGITSRSRVIAQIFESTAAWPLDLAQEYRDERTRVIVALKALQRLRPTGTIDKNPKAVHTRIPHLEKLLKSK